MITLTEEQEMICTQVAAFAQKEISPKAAEIDDKAKFPKDIIRQLGEMGLMGVCVPEEYGGSGMDYLSYAVIGEEINAVCASTGVIFSAHNSLGCGSIKLFGTEVQKKKYLPDMASGKKIGSFALSEPVSGSDAGALACMYEDKGDHFLINGTKNFITSGPESSIVILFATNDRSKGHKSVSAFIVEKPTDGLSVGKLEKKLGIRGSSTSQLIFENVKVPKKALLGKEGMGFKIAMAVLDTGRVGIGAQALGIARAALEAAKKFIKEREVFGKAIGEHQVPRFMIADMAVRLEASRLLVWKAASLQDQGKNFTKEAAMAKLYASESANFITDKALQLHGGYGFCKEYPVERYYRDQRITEIYEGTSEVQRMVIAAFELKD